MVFHPRHDLTLARLLVSDIERIIDEWASVYLKRGSEVGIKYVQIFEVCLFLSSAISCLLGIHGFQNKGATMGCSNPHPHGQVWSLSEVPSLPVTELASLLAYAHSTPPSSSAPKDLRGRPHLLLEYAHFEAHVLRDEGRVVVQNDHWVALVPWWAIWPFEILRQFARL